MFKVTNCKRFLQTNSHMYSVIFFLFLKQNIFRFFLLQFFQVHLRQGFNFKLLPCQRSISILRVVFYCLPYSNLILFFSEFQVHRNLGLLSLSFSSNKHLICNKNIFLYCCFHDIRTNTSYVEVIKHRICQGLIRVCYAMIYSLSQQQQGIFLSRILIFFLRLDILFGNN